MRGAGPLARHRLPPSPPLGGTAAESFFSTLEFELLVGRRFATRAEARRAVAGWIDVWYNRRRRHSTLGMRAPVDFELLNAEIDAEAA